MPFYRCGGGSNKMVEDKFTISGATATYDFSKHFKSYDDFVNRARWVLFVRDTSRYIAYYMNCGQGIETKNATVSHDDTTVTVQMTVTGSNMKINIICY